MVVKKIVRQREIRLETAVNPFFRASNQARLREAIHGLEAGQGLVRKTMAELEAMEKTDNGFAKFLLSMPTAEEDTVTDEAEPKCGRLDLELREGTF